MDEKVETVGLCIVEWRLFFMEEILIKNGNVVFEEDTYPADILVRDGKIAAFFKSGEAPADIENVLDITGLYVMPGSIDPHTHWGIYKDYKEDVVEDSKRAVIGGLTTVLQFHRHNYDYFDTIPDYIKFCDENSMVDYTFSLGLVKKAQVEDIEKYMRELKITSFKFYLDKTNRLEEHYGLTPGTGLLGNKREVMDILKKLKSLDENAVLCIHCEDTEIFYPEQRLTFDNPELDQHSLAAYSMARPDFGEVSAILSVLWVNHVVEGNMYIVHTSTGDGVKVKRQLMPLLKGKVGMETCPHYLVLNEDAPAKLNATVVPPIRKASDSEELWEGIKDGTVTSMGTDNCPCNLYDKYKKGDDVEHVIPGFPGAGIILPTLISEGYHKRGISLSQLSKVNSINSARKFGLKSKGEMKIGFDADFAIMDLDWERTIDKDLFGHCDFSIYDGMTFKGWPRYTMVRGQIVQKDGQIVSEPTGKFIPR